MRCLLCTLVSEQALDKHHGRRVALQCARGGVVARSGVLGGAAWRQWDTGPAGS